MAWCGGIAQANYHRKTKMKDKNTGNWRKAKTQIHSCNHLSVCESFLSHPCTWCGFLLLGVLVISLSLCLSCCHLIFLLLLFSLSYIIFVVLRLINRGWGSSLCGSPSLLSFSHTAILICPSTFHHLKWERVLQLWCHSITTDLFLSSH